MLKINRLRPQDIFKIPANSFVAKIASASSILVGSLVLVGWWLNIEVLKQGFVGSPATMKFNTALCFVLSGVSLLVFLTFQENNNRERGERTIQNYSYSLTLLISRVCGIVVITIAALTLCQYLFGWNFGIDELVFRDSSGSLATSHPGRMGANTALNFVLVNVALQFLIHPKTQRSYWYAQILALISSLISFQALMGYAYKVKILYGIAPYTTSMAFHTAVLFSLLSVGILWAQPEQGLMRVVTSDSYGGLLARRLLIAAIAVPFILGWVIVEGQRAGQYDPAFAVSVFAIVLIVIFTILIWQSARIIERLSHERDISDGLRRRAQEALRAYEDKLASFVDANVIGIAFADIYGGIHQVNDEYLRIIGYTRQEFLAAGLSWQEITPPEYRHLDQQGIAEAKANAKGACTPYQKEYIRKDGSRIPVLVGYVLLGEKREESVAFILDLSERKQAEEVLRNQHKWLEDVLNLMPRPLLFIEPGTARVIFANRSADELAGGEFPKGVPAAEYHTVYHYTDAAGNPIPNEKTPGVRVALGERLDGVEVDWHTSSGVRSLLIFADTLPAMHGHPAICILVFQDISKLKQAEKALSLGYQRLKLLFETANALLSSQQPVELIDSVFRKLSEQIGLDVYFNYLVEDNSEIMRLESYSGISPELAKEIQWLAFGEAVCGTVAQQRRPIPVENVQQSTDRKTELIRSLGISAYYCYPLMAQGRLLGTLSFGSRTRLSFTENQKGMMQAVCDQIAIAMERASLIASLQQQTEQLQQANRIKDEFLGILSHELRSPLNAILGWAQVLQRSKLNETQIAKAMETIERNAKAQTQLIEDLLDISRMNRGKLRLNVRTCDLVAIIESSLETVRLAAQSKGIDLRFSLLSSLETENKHPHDSYKPEDSIFLVSGDCERLQQIVWNLLSNAIKFTPPGGKVEVQLSVVSDISASTSSLGQQTIEKYAQIQVIDTGIGVSSDFLPFVFERFRQADSSSTRTYGGLGLGLAIVRHLVELHGGTIHADSPGKQQGATFTVKLPILKSLPLPSPALVSSPPFSPSLAGVRILVVDNQVDSRELIITVLEQCQAEVRAVASVPEALEIIRDWKPHVLVSDIGMPEENGYSLIRKLRSQPPELGGNIPAAALTAYAKAEERVRAIQEGYQLHLPKPVEPAELATVVASLVGRS
ncbi:MAG: ATP-binding protein [Nostoc sp. ChiSLP02]|nr:ATP-binding protein [Nostoc sp. DedSLP05]MDZ8099059.1 ATP-binding protein [Nostoc sp. DedSLP01]MDZ8189122.1 ATP-binding protein [Nostoc sp. ChiSLP02]